MRMGNRYRGCLIVIVSHFLLMSLNVYAQDTLLSHPMLVPDSSVTEVKEFMFTAQTQGVFYSNGIGSRWLRDWARGGEISRGSNKKQLSKLPSKASTLGIWATNLDIQAPLFADSVSNQDIDNKIGIQVGQNSVFRGNYDPQIFQLIFLGNKGLDGQRLSGKNNELETFQYRSIGINWSHANYKEYTFWDFGINWVESSQYTRWAISRYEIGFAEGMQNVDLDYVSKRQTLSEGQKGVGFSTQLQWEELKGPLHWFVRVKDLGWIKYHNLQTDRWNGKGVYSGFNTQTLQNADSLSNFLAPFSQHRASTIDKWVTLPTSLNMGFVLRDKWAYSMNYYFGGQWGHQSIGRLWSLEKGMQVFRFRVDALHSLQNQWGLQGSIHWINYRGLNIAIAGSNWLRTAAGDASFFSGRLMLNMAF